MTENQLPAPVASLLACPFCGNAGKPTIFDFDGEPYVPGFEVRCDASGWVGMDGRGCGASSGWGETQAEAIAAWNRRALSHPAALSGGDSGAVGNAIAWLLDCLHHANPTDDSQWHVRPGRHAEFSKAVCALTAALAAAPEGSEDMVLVPKKALDWLNGEGPDDDGIWFGDAERIAGSGAFWWRTVFNRMRKMHL